MTTYQAKPNALIFEVTNDNGWTGKLTYESWFRFNARIKIPNHSGYQIAPKGFWGTTIELKDSEKVLLKFKMNWSGEIVIQTYFNGIEKDYLFKHRGLFKESFVLIDQQGTELLVMKPFFKWKTQYEYEINTTAEFEMLSHKEILLLNSLHCANYYLSMVMSTSGV